MHIIPTNTAPMIIAIPTVSTISMSFSFCVVAVVSCLLFVCITERAYGIMVASVRAYPVVRASQ
jgi:hypothetical protein